MLIDMKCHCGTLYRAKEADLARGYGRSCSKSCAAIRRDFGRNAGQRADGLKVKRTKPKPSTARKMTMAQIEASNERDYQNAMSDAEMGWDAHKSAF